MAARKAKRQGKKAANSKKAPARKAATGRKRAAGLKKQVASPPERAGEVTVDAARRLWLSAESLVTSQVASPRRSVRKARTKVSR